MKLITIRKYKYFEKKPNLAIALIFLVSLHTF